MGTRSRRIILDPIDRVHRPCLTRVRSGGEGEIGVTTQLPQQGDLVVEPAPSPVRARVVESPVPMDEPEHDSALRLPEEAVFLAQSADETAHPIEEVLPAVSVVVDVDLDVGDV
jgi:hypothetical protein